MQLGILDRVTLLQVLPAEGNYITFKILNDLKAELSFSEKEIEECGLEVSENKIAWKLSFDKDVNVGDKANEIIVTALKKLDGEGKINASNVSLYEKFITE